MAADDGPAELAGQVICKDAAIGLRAVFALRHLLDEPERLVQDSALARLQPR